MSHGAPVIDPFEESSGALQTRLITSRRERLDRRWARQSFNSPFWRLYANSAPGAGISTSSVRLPLFPGALVLIPPWLSFETRLARSPRVVWQDYLHFECPSLPSVLQRRIFVRPLRLARTGGLKALADRWQHGLSDPRRVLADRAWAQAMAQAAFAAALEALDRDAQRLCFQWIRRKGGFGPVLDHIDRHLGAPLRNASLAALCGRSEDHFIRAFRREIGVSPGQYVIDRRVSTAAGWLAETSRTIDDIAAAAGFVDRFHFSRCFKARIGLPPVQYRRIHRAGPPSER